MTVESLTLQTKAVTDQAKALLQNRQAPMWLGGVLLAGVAFFAPTSGNADDPLTLVGIALKLGLVIGLMYGLAHLARTNHLPQTLIAAKRRPMEVVDKMSLGNRQAIQLVRVADRVLVLGVTAGQINLLTELTEEEATTALANKQVTPGSFLDAMSQFTNRQ